jgi:transposase-like protein
VIGNRKEKPETPDPHSNERPWERDPFEVRTKSRAAHPLNPAKGRPPKILGVGCATRPEKQVVIGIRQRNGDLRLIHAEDAKSATVREIIKANIGSHVEVIVTDESAIYPWALDKMQKNLHKTINHSREYAHGDVHTNTVESAFSLLKRGIVGTWHKVSAKHLPAYLDEMCFRFNNRKNPYLFRDTMLKLIDSPNLEYKHLTAKGRDEAA